MYDIISIGAATKDVYLISKDFKLIKSGKFPPTGVGECFTYGSKMELGDVFFDIGGGATNSAFTFANLGLKAAVCSRVGKDIFGLEILHLLADKGISSMIVTDQNHKTAYSTILVKPESDRTILVYRGASANFSDKDINWSKLNTKWIYLSSVAGSTSLLNRLFSFVKASKIKIAWNPGGEELKLGKQKLARFMKDAYIFIVNKEEAQKLTGKKEIKDIFKEINRLSPGYNIVTDGGNGAYLSDGFLIYHAPAIATEVKNTTGAGDAFGAGFATGMALKNDWDYALRLGILNSHGVLQEMGAKNGLLTKLPNTADLKKVKITILR
ncbi:MAG: carbohydrate kinase family protein [Candidatus Parcubacteria bacterium]|nr:carbohydrate kinase family protein [Candidatus Parcubacteria bacterium]